MNTFDYRYPDKSKCKASVSVRGNWRLHPGLGYRISYSHRQCSRKPILGGYCKQHAKAKTDILIKDLSE